MSVTNNSPSQNFSHPYDLLKLESKYYTSPQMEGKGIYLSDISNIAYDLFCSNVSIVKG